MDICVLYGPANKELVSQMVENVFNNQAKVRGAYCWLLHYVFVGVFFMLLLVSSCNSFSYALAPSADEYDLLSIMDVVA